MADNELVYVPQQEVSVWYKSQPFWIGVGSSLLASFIFWYLLRDMLSDDSQDGEEPYEAMKAMKGDDDAV